jgi:peptidoglycan hydrolase-like protein with peptidoglycan-binding domain
MVKLVNVALIIGFLLGGLVGCKTIDALGPGVSNVPGSMPDPPADRYQLVREVQTMLLEKGYNPGPVDGQEGPMTKSALRSFQTSQGRPLTPGVTDEAYVQLSSDKRSTQARNDTPECVRNFKKQGMLRNYRTTATLGDLSPSLATQRLVRALGQKGFVINEQDRSTGYVNATFDAGPSKVQLSAFIESGGKVTTVELNYAATGAALGSMIVPASLYRNDLCWFVDAMRGERTQ